MQLHHQKAIKERETSVSYTSSALPLIQLLLERACLPSVACFFCALLFSLPPVTGRKIAQEQAPSGRERGAREGEEKQAERRVEEVAGATAATAAAAK